MRSPKVFSKHLSSKFSLGKKISLAVPYFEIILLGDLLEYLIQVPDLQSLLHILRKGVTCILFTGCKIYYKMQSPKEL